MSRSRIPELVVLRPEPEVIAAARALAWWPHANMGNKVRYRERQAAFTRLRTALAAAPSRVGRGPVRVEYGLLLRAARRLAACSDSNRFGLPYYERREAFAQLRGALEVYDRSLQGADSGPESVAIAR